MKTYTLSYYRTGVETTVRRRPWWNIFGRDKLWARTFEDRRVITGLSENEAYLLTEAFCDPPARLSTFALRDLITKIIGETPTMLQLELENPVPQYITTSSK